MCRRRYAYKSFSLQVTAVQMNEHAHIRTLCVQLYTTFESAEYPQSDIKNVRSSDSEQGFLSFNRLYSFCTEDRAYIVLVFEIIVWSVFLILKDILKTRTAVTEVLDLCPLIGDGFQDFLL